MITIRSERALGTVLRRCRSDAGLTVRQVAAIAHLSPSGVSKREHGQVGYVSVLVDHAHALGYAVALIPPRHRGSRPTGTGWPA